MPLDKGVSVSCGRVHSMRRELSRVKENEMILSNGDGNTDVATTLGRATLTARFGSY